MNVVMPLTILLLCVAGMLGTSLLAVVSRRRAYATGVVYGLCLVLALAGGAAALYQLLGADAVPHLELPIGLPWLQMHFRLDSLSAFFLVVVNLIAVMASLYGISYGHHEKEPWRVLPFYPLFLAGMNLVVMADDAYAFLLAWEFMSLSSWLLVLATHKEPDTSHAAYVYIVMACIGTVALFMAFGLLAGGDGAYSFAAIRARQLTPLAAHGVLLLALIGAGAKAGVVPLHAWLPLAHAAAPSHVSALMSGVMTKVAIYGILRLVFDLVGAPYGWWGTLVLALGSCTAFMGILYAMMQDDLKRLLAYSTVKNVGIIIAALGLALSFRAYNFPALAALALTAALFHVLNHALFKSLLFMGAGAVMTATGQRNMEKMGGLIHTMPVTAFVFLVGATAISALPPLNGFVSEWLMFQALLGGVLVPEWLMKFLVPVAGALIALAAALAGACFVKAYGIVFLGRARTPAMSAAHDVDAVMLAPMLVLAVLCALVGVFPAAALALLRPAVALLIPAALPPMIHTNWLLLVPMAEHGSSYSGLTMLLAIAALAISLIVVIHRFASDKVRRGAAWDCGFPSNLTDTQYTASSFAQPLRRVFATSLFGAREKIDMPAPGDMRPAQLQVAMRDPIWDMFYVAPAALVAWITEKIDVVQTFGIRRHLSIMFGMLVLLLSVVAVLQ